MTSRRRPHWSFANIFHAVPILPRRNFMGSVKCEVAFPVGLKQMHLSSSERLGEIC